MSAPPTPVDDFIPRPNQADVLAYTGGRMGVAAVPGSGKTITLSALAAKLVAEGNMRDDQEVLVVTLVNTAVQNFARQVRVFLRARGTVGRQGYRVRTLHALAGDIVRERPDLVGLSEVFTIVDEREAYRVLLDATYATLRAQQGALAAFVDEEFQDRRDIRERVGPEMVVKVAEVFVRQAKDWRMTPDDVRARQDAFGMPLPVADVCAQIYAAYQRGLNIRGGVDFQDLIRLALDALERDAGFLRRLRDRWPYILEDEAQDSAELQERMLALLAGPRGNWVRMGDPNQAIYESFTTANPQYLRDFIAAKGTQPRSLPASGRFQNGVIRLANQLIRWAQQHPTDAVRARQPLAPPWVEPVSPDDPQPNPPDLPKLITLHDAPLSPDAEAQLAVRSVAAWLAQHPDQTAAILVPRNKRGEDVMAALRDAGVPAVELLGSTSTVRDVAAGMGVLLRFLAAPTSLPLLAHLYSVAQGGEGKTAEAAPVVQHIKSVVRKVGRVEDFLWPIAEDWLDTHPDTRDNPDLRDHLAAFRDQVRRWQGAAVLPVDQLLLTAANDLYVGDAASLAAAYRLAVAMRVAAALHPAWRLVDYAKALDEVASNQRRMLGGLENEGFNPDAHRGQVCVATVHKAKGLEWDRVHLLSVNSYDYPASAPEDTFYGEERMFHDGLNPQAEALAQLRALRDNAPYVLGAATRQARDDFATERVRLLYVGITRARRELILTWNSGRSGNEREAAAMTALRTFRNDPRVWGEENVSAAARRTPPIR